jgi:hypothetical protein
MAKEKKVRIRDTPKYTSSSDEESSDNEIDYSDLFKGLDRSKVDKINELIDALNEKDRLLEKQEDILYDEHDKFINVQKSLALEIKKHEILSSKLSTYHDYISSLKTLDDDLNTKLEEFNVTSSSVEHVVICHTRISGHQDPGANIITRCAGTKSHTYDESWHRIECHIFTT